MKELKELKRINQRLLELNQEINSLERIWAAELKDRQRLGLEGEAAIKHYNEWMEKYGI